MKKILMPITRHSRDLHAAIETVRQQHPDVEEVESEDGWQVKVGAVVLSDVCSTQWQAWMEAKDGTGRSE